MADIDNVALEHLRHIRGQLDRMEHRPEDVTLPLGHVERSAADHSVQLAINVKLDRLDGRVTCIEKRLDPVES
jgi:hypothetical protein